jgi:hypothetical protein
LQTALPQKNTFCENRVEGVSVSLQAWLGLGLEIRLMEGMERMIREQGEYHLRSIMEVVEKRRGQELEQFI